MRVVVSTLALLLVPALPLRAEVAVQIKGGVVDITAKAAPLSEVLDLLARRTGMKVTYEGPAPRQLVTVSLSGRTPVDAVHDLLEGQGLSYALMVDAAGTGVRTLLMTGSPGPGARTATAAATTPRRSAVAPPSNVDSADDESDAEEPNLAAPQKGLEGIPPALRELIQAAQSPEKAPARPPTPPDPSASPRP